MSNNPQPPGSSQTVVVIDDDCDSLSYLTTLLQRHGLRCAAFWRSEEALEFIHNHPVRLVVTDVFMPEMDGVQLLSEIRKIRPETAIVALTGYGQPYLRCMKMLGAVDSLRKPIDAGAFIELVARCLDQGGSLDPCTA